MMEKFSVGNVVNGNISFFQPAAVIDILKIHEQLPVQVTDSVNHFPGNKKIRHNCPLHSYRMIGFRTEHEIAAFSFQEVFGDGSGYIREFKAAILRSSVREKKFSGQNILVIKFFTVFD